MKRSNFKNQEHLVKVVDWGREVKEYFVKNAKEAKEMRDKLVSEIGASNIIDGNYCVFDEGARGVFHGYCLVLY